MSPEESIADLDAALSRNGEDIKLKRQTPAAGGILLEVSAICPAFVRSFRLTSGQAAAEIDEPMRTVTISPTPLLEQNWPGPQTGPAPLIPKAGWDMPRKGDIVVMPDQGGISAKIMVVDPIRRAGTVVRINMLVEG